MPKSSLGAALSALVPAVVDGLVRQVVIVDGGSSDRTLKIAEDSGADLVRSPRGRGNQLAEGARHARFPWLLFLHADTVLEPGWEREAGAFVERVDSGQRPPAAAAFRFALDDMGFLPRLIETGVAMRCTLFRLPYGDQGLLMPRRLYEEIGGFRPLPLMEDVDIVRRLGRARTSDTAHRCGHQRDALQARRLPAARRPQSVLSRPLLCARADAADRATLRCQVRDALTATRRGAASSAHEAAGVTIMAPACSSARS